MVLDRVVRLDFDQTRTDRFDRTLAYVYLADGTFVNAEIVRQGYGHALLTYPFRYLDQFRAYQREAREAGVGLWASSGGLAVTAGLLISEYVEGSGDNKAIEIYNGTGEAIDLAAGQYRLTTHFNGNPEAGLTIPLEGTVSSGHVYVVAHAQADERLRVRSDQLIDWGWFNGDDTVVLWWETTVLDAIGQLGVDPGSRWGTGFREHPGHDAAASPPDHERGH